MGNAAVLVLLAGVCATAYYRGGPSAWLEKSNDGEDLYFSASEINGTNVDIGAKQRIEAATCIRSAKEKSYTCFFDVKNRDHFKISNPEILCQKGKTGVSGKCQLKYTSKSNGISTEKAFKKVPHRSVAEDPFRNVNEKWQAPTESSEQPDSLGKMIFDKMRYILPMALSMMRRARTSTGTGGSSGIGATGIPGSTGRSFTSTGASFLSSFFRSSGRTSSRWGSYGRRSSRGWSRSGRRSSGSSMWSMLQLVAIARALVYWYNRRRAARGRGTQGSSNLSSLPAALWTWLQIQFNNIQNSVGPIISSLQSSFESQPQTERSSEHSQQTNRAAAAAPSSEATEAPRNVEGHEGNASDSEPLYDIPEDEAGADIAADTTSARDVSNSTPRSEYLGMASNSLKDAWESGAIFRVTVVACAVRIVSVLLDNRNLFDLLLGVMVACGVFYYLRSDMAVKSWDFLRPKIDSKLTHGFEVAKVQGEKVTRAFHTVRETARSSLIPQVTATSNRAVDAVRQRLSQFDFATLVAGMLLMYVVWQLGVHYFELLKLAGLAAAVMLAVHLVNRGSATA